MKPTFSLNTRAAGVLLHLTSLPGPYGVGDLGPEAYRFVDALAAAGIRWWQMLPVGPAGHGGSPYDSPSAFAGHCPLISPDRLAQEGLLRPKELKDHPVFPTVQTAGQASSRFKERLLWTAFHRLRRQGPSPLKRSWEAYLRHPPIWLPDFALFSALKSVQPHRSWVTWDKPLRRHEPAAVEQARRALSDLVQFQIFMQFQFHRQWTALKRYAESRGVGLIGDVPIFVAHESADVWANQELFHLDHEGRPTLVAGVPPDYFTEDGQRWGNPLYRWDLMRRQRYGWWVDRIRITLERFNAIRLDHFIGFSRGWAIKASEPTARHGHFMRGPGEHLFNALKKQLGTLPIIAEDLGVLTENAKALRIRYGFPGMRILQFAFGQDPASENDLPHNFPRHSVVYTGTHDNDTTVGWFRDRSSGSMPEDRRFALRYIPSTGREIHWDMIRLAFRTVSNLAVIPAQDLLGLGARARMNKPGTSKGNWAWRLKSGEFNEKIIARLRDLAQTYSRIPR